MVYSPPINGFLVTLRAGILAGCSVLMAGCPWFISDKDESEEVLLPTASFSQSSQSGTSPHEVSFSDQSEQGSNPITGWYWDFGDGNSSSLQNPSHIYHEPGNYRVSLRVTSVDGSNTWVSPNSVEVEPPLVNLTVSVMDAGANPLTDVTAESEAVEIVSQALTSDGRYRLMLRPSTQRGVIKLSKEGFADQFLFVESVGLDERIAVVMLPRAEPLMVFVELGGGYYGRDGAGVDLPANALVDENGVPVTGHAELYISPVNTDDFMENFAFPGSYYGRPSGEDSDEMLFTYGVVEFTFMQSGKHLQLAEGVTANLRMPVYATHHVTGDPVQLGHEIPLWTLDETTGIWQQEDIGLVVADPSSPTGFALQASTSHFSLFNTDAWAGMPAGQRPAPDQRTWCDAVVTVDGIENGKVFQFISLLRSSGWAGNTINRDLIKTDEPITFRIPVDATVSVSALYLNRHASGQLICTQATPTVALQLVIEEGEPEFVSWAVDVQPNFELDEVTQKQVIVSNRVMVGGYFYGADVAEIESPAILQALNLYAHMYYQFELSPDEPMPSAITARLTGESGAVTERVDPLVFIDSHPPIVEYYSIAGFEPFKLSWLAKGMDRVELYYVGEDYDSVGIKIFESTSSQGTATLPENAGENTYIRATFRNQYGFVERYVRLSANACFAGSEDPNCNQPL